jgi:hypothetical protein
VTIITEEPTCLKHLNLKHLNLKHLKTSSHLHTSVAPRSSIFDSAISPG